MSKTSYFRHQASGTIKSELIKTIYIVIDRIIRDRMDKRSMNVVSGSISGHKKILTCVQSFGDFIARYRAMVEITPIAIAGAFFCQRLASNDIAR